MYLDTFSVYCILLSDCWQFGASGSNYFPTSGTAPPFHTRAQRVQSLSRNLQGIAWVDVPGFIWLYHTQRLGLHPQGQATWTLVLEPDEAAQIGRPQDSSSLWMLFFCCKPQKRTWHFGWTVISFTRNCWNQSICTGNRFMARNLESFMEPPATPVLVVDSFGL